MTKKIIIIVINLLILGCIGLVCIAPIIPTAIASEIAQANGCNLDESGVHPCIINGVDQGENLLTMAMMGWLLIVSVQVAAVLMVIYVVVWIIIILVKVIRKYRKKANA